MGCRKCQGKLKGQAGMRMLVKLKKTIKGYNREHSDVRLHVISVPCFNLCPKGGVTICLPAAGIPALSVLRNKDDIDQLYQRG